MQSANLTRSECSERARLLRNVGYAVDLDLTGAADGVPTFRSTTTVRFDAGFTEAGTWLDLIAESVESIVCNGNALPVADTWDGARIALPDLDRHNVVTVIAQCRYMSTGEGLHRFRDPVDGETYLYSQFEVADARRVYACFEQPDLKAPFQLTVTAPTHWEIAANARTPVPIPAKPGFATWEFAPTPPIPTYITAVVAGPYYSVSDTHEGQSGTYPLRIMCRASLGPHLDPDEIFTVTKQGLDFFEGIFDVPYPFDKYDQIFVPEFNAGAMENAACVTYLEDYVFRSRVTQAAYEVRANTVLHELAHMWFGNLVTMRWWDDLWLNEAFAEWASHFASVRSTRHTDAWTTFQNQRKTWAYRQDQLPSTHPIAADMVDLEAVQVNFDGITYAKGAAALRQLVAWVGEDAFLHGLRAYFRQHAWLNTDLADLLDALTWASGRELRHWSSEWLETAGVNLLRPELKIDRRGRYSAVAIAQEPPASPRGLEPVLRDHRIRIGAYSRSDGSLVRTAQVELDVSGPGTVVSELKGVKRPDLLLINDDDLTYAKVRLDEESLATIAASIGDLDDSLARALVFGSAWDMTRDAEVAIGDYLRLVLNGIRGETDIGVVQQILRQAQTALDLYSEPRNRDGYAGEVETALREMLLGAEPGSDSQLAFIRALAVVTSSSADIRLLRGLLDGTGSLPGLAVDADLRWSMLKRLVIRGEAGRPEIEAELARDGTATGARNAQEAFAQIPTPAAKQAAWDTALNDDSLSNHMLAATVAGIMVFEHRDLIRPLVNDYFNSVERIAATRTTEMSHQIIAGLYPSILIEPATITKTETFLLHHADLDPSARRLINEGLDGVMRAMLCQERDAR